MKKTFNMNHQIRKTLRDHGFDDRGGKNHGREAGVSGAGVSNAGAGGSPSEVTLETVSRELYETCKDLCARRNTLLENATGDGAFSGIAPSLLARARHLDARARSILWVVEKAGLAKLEMQLDPLVTLPSHYFLLLYTR